MNPTPAVENPTRVRHGVLGFCCVLSMITYLDRVCFGTVAPLIVKEFSLSEAQKGYIFAAFTLAYSLFEVPTGWLGDRFGARKTLIRIVLWWSFFTVLTGLIQPSAATINLGFVTLGVPFAMMLVVRFLFGLGEAGAYPNIAAAFRNWFPYEERGFAKGAVWMAGRFAGGVTPFVVNALLINTVVDGENVTLWRHTFYIFGGLGLAWCVFFLIWFRDRPEDKAGVNAAELALIRGSEGAKPQTKLQVPWGRLFRSGNLWLLCFMYFCASFGWYFNITYLPGFLEEQFGMVKGDKWSASWWSVSIMAGLPLLFGSAACLVGGLLTDLVIRRTGNRRWGRRIFGLLGHGMCAVFYFGALAVVMMNPDKSSRTPALAWLFVLAVGMASFSNDMTMGSAWASCLDIGGKFSGIVAGCMNTIGNFGGFVANIVTGLILDAYVKDLPVTVKKDSIEYFQATQPAWILNLALFGGVYILAVILWMRFDATRPVVPEALVSEQKP